MQNVTLKFYPSSKPELRLFALWYFGILITLWTILGHLWLGFEQSWAQPVAAIAAASVTHLLLEWIDARSKGRQPRYAAGGWSAAHFFVPAVIPGAAVGMLLSTNELIWPMVFAAALSIASKVIVRAPVGNATQHVFNPSNFGITLTLVFLPFVGLAPPYHFTTNVAGAWNWIIPGVILASGILIHAVSTGRLPLIAAWIGGFLIQALVRAWWFDIPVLVPLVPMTSAAFILFTLYMIPDPATTPLDTRRQIAFGLAVAGMYGVLQGAGVVFALFLALFLVCALRGIGLYLQAVAIPWPALLARRA